MKKYMIYLIVAFGPLLNQASYAQNTALNQQFEIIEQEEKAALKEKVIDINKKLDDGSISAETAAEMKEDAAMYHARRIESRKEEIQRGVVRDTIPEETKESVKIVIGSKEVKIEANVGADTIKYKEKKHYPQTTSRVGVSFGKFHTLTDGSSLNDGPYDLGKSRMFEMYNYFKTRLFKNSGLLNLHYGASLGFYSMHLSDNQLFVRDGDQTILERSTVNLDKTRFGVTQFQVPLHLEFDFSRAIRGENGIRPQSDKSVRIGAGGFVGLTIASYAKQKYNLDGQRIKNKVRGNFNANTFIYGLSGYVGYKSILFFAKYQLTPLFESNIVDEYPLTFGIRFEWN